ADGKGSWSVGHTQEERAHRPGVPGGRSGATDGSDGGAERAQHLYHRLAGEHRVRKGEPVTAQAEVGRGGRATSPKVASPIRALPWGDSRCDPPRLPSFRGSEPGSWALPSRTRLPAPGGRVRSRMRKAPHSHPRPPGVSREPPWAERFRMPRLSEDAPIRR